MSDMPGSAQLLGSILRAVAASAFSYIVLRSLINYLDPTREQKKKSKLLAEKILSKIGIPRTCELNEYELAIATNIISSDIKVSWADVGGYITEIANLQDEVIFPLSATINSKLISPPKGVLLYGPPGCGKTLIAKALAKSSGARFINLEVSTLTDKWFGESEKLCTAVFSLARKLQPAIIFIDEIDCFLRARTSNDHETTGLMKSVFMTLWDGFLTDDNKVIVLGATNRPADVDPAFLRRMPSKYLINLPDCTQRISILKIILQKEEPPIDIDMKTIAMRTSGFSGADLKELCRLACINRAKELFANGRSLNESVEERSLNEHDFEIALARVMQSNNVAGYLSDSILD